MFDTITPIAYSFLNSLNCLDRILNGNIMRTHLLTTNLININSNIT